MELTTAMLADGARAAEGKLYILGGQWDRIISARFPAQHPSMAVVLVVKVDYSEAPKSCELVVQLSLDGQPMGARIAARMLIGHAPGLTRGAPQFAPVAVTFTNVAFESPGRYEWVVTADTEVLGRIPLEVVQGTVPSAPQGPSRETA
jgi:hypothetical protein